MHERVLENHLLHRVPIKRTIVKNVAPKRKDVLEKPFTSSDISKRSSEKGCSLHFNGVTIEGRDTLF